MLDVLGEAGALKRVPRQGWRYIDVSQPESVADHSYRLALMALLVAQFQPDVDPLRAVTLALVHDLPEAITGDLTPLDQALRDQDVDRALLFTNPPSYSNEAELAKHQAEEAALAAMTHRLPTDVADFLIDAWREYEASETNEARLVRQLDKVEALLQAYEYRETQPDLAIRSFELGTEGAIDDPLLITLLEAIGRRFGTPNADPQT
jgi:putative hydrolase of HD superfamily